MTQEDSHRSDQSLAGKRIALVGKLASMSRRDAEKLIREHGGQLVAALDDAPNLVVLGDEAVIPKPHVLAGRPENELAPPDWDRGSAELIREAEFFTRLGLVDSGQGVERLYTPAMLAELLSVPVAAIREWRRRGALQATREIRRLAYFDFTEVQIARKLSALLAAGCSLSVINRKLQELHRLLPDVPRPLADVSVVADGKRLVIRRDNGLAEPSGQLLIDFDVPPPQPGSVAGEALPSVIPLAVGMHPGSASLGVEQDTPQAADELRSLAMELEECGRCDEAIEVARAILVSGEFTAEDQFFLAELLYRKGDLASARERYYMAIELDEDYVEARANLGCVLAEMDEPALAEAAFRGALEYHPGYADAHFHLANLLERGGRRSEAVDHWREFMELAPASPWAEQARDHLAATTHVAGRPAPAH